MTRFLAATAGGVAVSVALCAAFTAAFCYGIWPISVLLDRDTIHPF